MANCLKKKVFSFIMIPSDRWYSYIIHKEERKQIMVEKTNHSCHVVKHLFIQTFRESNESQISSDARNVHSKVEISSTNSYEPVSTYLKLLKSLKSAIWRTFNNRAKTVTQTIGLIRTTAISQASFNANLLKLVRLCILGLPIKLINMKTKHTNIQS